MRGKVLFVLKSWPPFVSTCGTMSLYVGSDSFLICLTSGDIVICRILLVSAEFSSRHLLPRPGVGVCRTAYPRLRRATGANAT